MSTETVHILEDHEDGLYVDVEFTVCGPDRSVGIMEGYLEDVDICDSEPRKAELLALMDEAEWERVEKQIWEALWRRSQPEY